MRTGVMTYIDNSGAGLSPGLWKDCPIDEINGNNNNGYGFFDDFNDIAYTVPTTEANFGRYRGFSSTGGVLANMATELGGVLTLGSDGDNEGSSIGQVGFPYKISLSNKSLWFECRVKSSTISDTKHGILVGLVGATAITTTRSVLTAIEPIAADGTIVDTNFVGFHRLEGDGDYFNTVYKADGVTQVTVKDNAKVIVADTYVKLGMYWNYFTGILTFYADGVALPDTYTMASGAGTDFPNDVTLGLVMAVLNATGTTPGNAYIDWWACYQLR